MTINQEQWNLWWRGLTDLSTFCPACRHPKTNFDLEIKEINIRTLIFNCSNQECTLTVWVSINGFNKYSGAKTLINYKRYWFEMLNCDLMVGRLNANISIPPKLFKPIVNWRQLKDFVDSDKASKYFLIK